MEHSVECEKSLQLQLAFIQRSTEYSRAATHLWNENKKHKKFMRNFGFTHKINCINHHSWIEDGKESLTVFYPSLIQCENSSCDILARAAQAQMHAFYRLLRKVELDILASTPCLHKRSEIIETVNYAALVLWFNGLLFICHGQISFYASRPRMVW